MESHSNHSSSSCRCCRSASCSNSVREFCLASSMHGLKYLVERESHTIHRCIWVIFFALGVMTSLFLSLQVWYKWEESPVVISIETSSHPVQNLVFPAVTICSVNKVSRQKFDALMTLPKYNATPYEDLRLSLRLMNDIVGILEQPISTMRRIRKSLEASNITLDDLLDVMRKVMVPCENMLVSCSWRGHVVNCGDIFERHITDNGYCCVFNTVQQENDKATDLFGDGARWVNSDDSPILKKPRMVPGTGVNTGLVVLLDAHVEDYTVITSKFDGFEVLIHDPNEFPDISERGVGLSAGTLMSVSMKAKQFYSKPFVKSVPFTKRKCYLHGEQKLDFYDNYTAPNCYVECMTKLMLRRCGCHPYYFPATVHDGIDKSCACPQLCDKTYYSIVPVFSQFPGKGFYLHAMGKNAKRTIPALSLENATDYANRNLAMLEVYFDERFCELYVLSVRFGFEDFVSSIGGLLGLGFGFSFISAVEFFYFLCIKNISMLINTMRGDRVQPLYTPPKQIFVNSKIPVAAIRLREEDLQPCV